GRRSPPARERKRRRGGRRARASERAGGSRRAAGAAWFHRASEWRAFSPSVRRVAYGASLRRGDLVNRRYDAILLDAGGVLVHPNWPMIAELLPPLGVSPGG